MTITESSITARRDERLAKCNQECDSAYSAICASPDVPGGTDAGMAWIAKKSRPIFDKRKAEICAIYEDWRKEMAENGFRDNTPEGKRRRAAIAQKKR